MADATPVEGSSLLDPRADSVFSVILELVDERSPIALACRRLRPRLQHTL